MNSKKVKKINRHVRDLLVLWIKSLLNEEEAKQVSLANYKELMPDQTHVFLQGKLSLSAYSEKWMRKKMKKLVSQQPTRAIESFGLQDVSAA
jgi:calcineurin-like phosphoesterase family protein